MSTKRQNSVYCCIIQEMKYIVDILRTVITLLNNEINLYLKKYFFQTYTTAIFHFFGRCSFIIMNVDLKKHMRFYISMMKSKAATGGVL